MYAKGEPVPRYFDIISVVFVGLLLLSNIAASKLIAIDTPWVALIFDGGAVLFPLTYILGDVLAEVYGFQKAKRVIILGFAMSILAAAVFYLVQIAPPAADYKNQAAFESVLGFVPRIVLASLIGYLVGQTLNAYVLVKVRERYGTKRLWLRLVTSTVVGEAADTVIFCTIAFYGVIVGPAFFSYLIVGYVYKLGVELVALPITYRVIKWFAEHEPAYSPVDVGGNSGVVSSRSWAISKSCAVNKGMKFK